MTRLRLTPKSVLPDESRAADVRQRRRARAANGIARVGSNSASGPDELSAAGASREVREQLLPPLLGLTDLIEREDVQAVDQRLGGGERAADPVEQPLRLVGTWRRQPH